MRTASIIGGGGGSVNFEIVLFDFRRTCKKATPRASSPADIYMKKRSVAVKSTAGGSCLNQDIPPPTHPHTARP